MQRIAVLQMTSGIDPAANAATLADAAEKAAGNGAAMLFTPEMTGLLDRDRKRAALSIASEDKDPTTLQARESAARHGIWVCLGSVAVKAEDRWANRSIVIDDRGDVAARYDKIHMFDVDLDTGESWRESNAYRPGETLVTVDTPIGKLGLAVCYDIRFPALFDAFGRAGCDAIAIPAAFTVPTGKAHWHILQRARAIEASAFVIAAAQTGSHEDSRETFGHSLVVDPWGEVLLDLGEKRELGFADIDPARISAVRKQIPSLANRRAFTT